MTCAYSGHCKSLAPKYEQLANAFQHAKDKVIIAKVDADGEGKPLGQKYGVTGFPSWSKCIDTHARMPDPSTLHFSSQVVRRKRQSRRLRRWSRIRGLGQIVRHPWLLTIQPLTTPQRHRQDWYQVQHQATSPIRGHVPHRRQLQLPRIRSHQGCSRHFHRSLVWTLQVSETHLREGRELLQDREELYRRQH
jgi:thiol-disulfide isomerase/thioredoxin